jgi:hypothetical protein
VPPDGKYAEGLRGFPTPNFVASDGGYIVFKIPSNNEWAGLILGAAQLLAQSYNWYQWGDMTPEEAAEAFRVIVNQAPYDTCGCNQPGGSRVLRVNNDGHIQQLTDGEWTEPTDDYAIPPVPPREEPTCDERRCAAAANAANVLQQLYEEVADAVAEGADEAEALAILIGAAVIIIGGWLGLALAALVGLITGGFFAFLEIAEFMTADLWTSDFTDKLQCFLYECSSCDGDVVTFDFQCLREKMAKYTDILDPNVITNIRLFGQVDFILYTIGVDGLNAAGATTAITDANCDECENTWCYAAFLDVNDGGFELFTGGPGTPGNYSSGQGWEAAGVNAWFGFDRNLLMGTFPFDFPVEVDTIDVHYNWTVGTAANTTEGIGIYTDAFVTNLISIRQDLTETGVNLSQHYAPASPVTMNGLDVWMQSSIGEISGAALMTLVQLTGHGEKPTFLEDMGWGAC